MQNSDLSFFDNQTESFYVLYYEQNQEVAERTLEILRKIFTHIDVVSTHQEALDKFAYFPSKYDFIFAYCDESLSLAQHIKHTQRDVTLLLTSNIQEPRYFIKMIELGVDGFIPQPYTQEEFLSALTKVTHTLIRRKDFQNDLDALIEYKEAAEMIMDELVDRIKHS